MRDELIEKIVAMLVRYGVEMDGIKESLVIILSDYEISVRETAIAVRNEDMNEYFLKKFITAKIVKGCTKRTIELYTVELKKILLAIGKPANEITTDDIRLYLALRDRRDGVTKTTQNNELRYLRSFFNYLYTEELLRSNPTSKIDAIKGPKLKRNAFSEMDVELMRAACKNTKERMIIEVLLSTGCRVSELVGIRLSDINNGAVVVHGKGEKDRTVYLNAKAQLAIEQYLKDRADTNPYLLPRMYTGADMKVRQLRKAYQYAANILPDGHMETSSIEQCIRKIGKRAGVKGAHPHRFRRTCATFALRRGMPIEQVSKMLGHEQISTTQIYLDLDEKDLEQAHKKYVI